VDRGSGAQEQDQAVRRRWRGSGARRRRRPRFQRAARKHDEEAQLYAFDILTLDGEDLRPLPLSLRKTDLARLPARRPDGIFVAPFEQGEIGPDLFRAACNMGLEGLVSKRVDRPYRGGRSPDRVKVKNDKHPAMERVKDAFA
jgi:bifunctional non-homologous end joining protein LigD